jgi:hypothetical protein
MEVASEREAAAATNKAVNEVLSVAAGGPGHGGQGPAGIGGRDAHGAGGHEVPRLGGRGGVDDERCARQPLPGRRACPAAVGRRCRWAVRGGEERGPKATPLRLLYGLGQNGPVAMSAR